MQTDPRNSMLEEESHPLCTDPSSKDRLYDLIVLCMYLLTKSTDGLDADNAIFCHVYDKAKRTFALISAFSSPCRELIQCGAMIALFEFGHGRVVTAYQTLSQTATMVHIIGISTNKHNEGSSKSTIDEEEEDCALWWGVFILDQQVILPLEPLLQALTICAGISI